MSHKLALRIDIISGGMSGVALALDMSRAPLLNVQLFESAPAFGEVGAGVSFGAKRYAHLRARGLANPIKTFPTDIPNLCKKPGSDSDALPMRATSVRARRHPGAPF
jgi:salicylate hydroxylase